MNTKTIKVHVLHYKEKQILDLPAIYSHLVCGAAINETTTEFNKDNSGDNISSRNKYFSELTGIYWVWKNTSSDIVGFCHYRRFFTIKDEPYYLKVRRWLYFLAGLYRRRKGLIYTSNIKHFQKNIISSKEIQNILNEYDAILPHPRLLKTTVEEHYSRHHDVNDLIILRRVIEKKYPEFIDSFNQVLKSNKLYANNMFITNKLYFEQFAKWWFTLLFEFEKSINLKTKTGYQERIMGFIAERLLNVWFLQKELKVKELPIIYFKSFKKIEEIDKHKKD